jgi:hypothetical protein
MPSKVEMPELPWQMVEKGIKRFKEVDMLEWVYHVRSENI